MSDQVSEIIGESKKFDESLDEKIFMWLKDGYNYIYSKTTTEKTSEYRYTTGKFYFPTWYKVDFKNEINLKDLRDKLIVNGIDYKNKTFEEFKTLMVKLNKGDEKYQNHH
jgi:hypothetical protein